MTLCIVTAFIELGRGEWSSFPRSTELYLKRFKPYLDMEEELVVFVDQPMMSRLKELKKRGDNMTLIPIESILLEIKAWSYIDREKAIMGNSQFKALIGHRAHCPETHNPRYNCIQHAKTDFVKWTIDHDISQAEYFAWSDFGYFSDLTKVPQRGFDLDKIDQGKINFCMINSIVPCDYDVVSTMINPSETCAGFFHIGNRAAHQGYNILYHQILLQFYSMGLVDDDQHIMLQCYRTRPDLFTLHHTGWHNSYLIFQRSSEKLSTLKSSPKVGIFGANGMLGCYVSTLLSNTVKITRSDYDILSEDESVLESLVSKGDLKVIVNCAGLIKQRNHPDEDMCKVNTRFPVMLAKICKRHNIKLIHISTDCVYDGANGSYNEQDAHTADDQYGKTKSLGESSDASIIRCSIIGHEETTRYSFLEWALDAISPINGFKDHLWNGVTCLQLAKVIKQMIDHDIWWDGVRHIFSPEVISKDNLVRMIRDIYGKDCEVLSIGTKKVDRSLSSIYPALFTIPSLKEQIKELKDSFLSISAPRYQ